MTYVNKHFKNSVLQLIAAVLLVIAADAQEYSVGNGLPVLIPGAPQSIAFSSNRDGNSEIYTMDPYDPDGFSQTRRTTTLATVADTRPEISPDGSEIVFSSNRDGNSEIFVMNFADSNVRQLTFTTAPTANTWPRWSPDGEWIAFQSGTNTDTQIYRIRRNASELTQVTHYVGLNQFPGWSPDGTRLAIRRDTEIYLINAADGLNPVRLTVTDSIPGAFNQMASFSPDGTRIAFFTNRAGYGSVFIMNSDGSGEPVNFTPRPDGRTTGWVSRAPAWSPNGEFIYFTAVRLIETGNSNEQIWVKPSAGGSETRLTSAGVNVEATVRRITAPTIASVTASPNVLWPADGKMIPVALTVDVTDNSDPSPVCRITDVTSSEPVGLEPDWEITGSLTLDLRALRLGSRPGRRYSVTVTCTNTSALSSSSSATVTVPHDQRRDPVGNGEAH